MKKWSVMMILVLVLLIPMPAQSQTCKSAVATSGNWGQEGAAARFQLFMEELLTANHRPMVKLTQNEAHSIFNSLNSYDQTPIQRLRWFGVCKILFVTITQTRDQIDRGRETVSIGSLGDLFRVFGANTTDLNRVLDRVNVFVSKHKRVEVMRFEATAQLISFPRDLLFSKTVEGTALLAEDKSGFIIVGPYSSEHQQTSRSEIDGLTLKRIAFVLLQAAYDHCQCL